jgi:hypothetical protein
VILDGVQVTRVDAFREVLQVLADLPGDRIATLQEGPGTATVFRRGRPPTADAGRIRSLLLRRGPVFDPDLVLPPAAEVVLVVEPLVGGEPEVGELNRPRLVRGAEPAQSADAIVPAVDAKPVEMEVIRAEGDLKDVVELGQRAVATDQEPPPDHRADAADPDV